MTWITVKHPSTNEKHSFNSDKNTYQDIKDQTKTLFKLDDNYDFCFQLVNNNGEKVTITENNQFLEHTSYQLEILPIDKQAPLSPSEKPQFDILCDGCYTPIRGSRFRCETCEDFDLCSICKSRVNHNPTHYFQVVQNTYVKSETAIPEQQQQIELNSTSITSSTQTIYICDNCDSDIVGIRHTCSSCPDFDLCHSCFSIVKQNHPEQHVFTTHLAGTELVKKTKKKQQEATSSCDTNIPIQHTGVHCDHCQSQVVSIRYKCGHCESYDLCTTCEQDAEQIHDKTHAFIKIRYPIQQLPKKPLLPKFKHVDEVQDSSSSLSSSTATLKSIDTSSASEPDIEETLNATLICDMNIPDGTITKPKETLVKIWKVKNSGTVDWPVGSNLEFNGGTMLSFYPNGQPKQFAIPSLAPGEETCITAELQAPTSPGHYTSYFCLCTPDGTPFSDNIWCTIVVSLEPEKSDMIFPTPSIDEYDAYEYDSYSTTTGDVSNTTVTYTDSQISCDDGDSRYEEEEEEYESSVHSVELQTDTEDFVIVDEEEEFGEKSPIASSTHSTTTITPQEEDEQETPTHSIHQEQPLETQVDSLEINESTADDLKKKELALKRLVGRILK